MKRNVAVILAGGVGTRLNLDKPKQFYKVAGKMVVEHTIDAFEHNSYIDEIAIVANPSLISDFEDIILRNQWKKVHKLLHGGKERYHSSLSAIQAYDNQDVNLIFHDAVRPLVSQRVINDVVEALKTHQAVDVAIPSADTIIEVDDGFVTSIPDRSRLRRGQTPQAFDRQVIAEAYKIGLKDMHFFVTDDCGVLKRYAPHVPIFVVLGEESNIKLTYKEDTYILDKLFQLRNTQASSLNEMDNPDLHDKVAVIFGGSYGIGKELADLLAHYGAHVHIFARSFNQVDVSKREQVSNALRRVVESEGHIDYVVNTAGVLHRQPLSSMSAETIENDINVNYLGAINVATEAHPYLTRSRGSLLLYTSSSYTRGRAMYSIYSSTKAAIVNFVQAIAQEWDADGIRVNCISPERTDTPMRKRNFGIEPKGTLLSAEKVARVSLATLLSDYNGQVVNVNRDK